MSIKLSPLLKRELDYSVQGSVHLGGAQVLREKIGGKNTILLCSTVIFLGAFYAPFAILVAGERARHRPIRFLLLAHTLMWKTRKPWQIHLSSFVLMPKSESTWGWCPPISLSLECGSHFPVGLYIQNSEVCPGLWK